MKKIMSLSALVLLAGCTTPAYTPDQKQDADAPMTRSYWSRKADDTQSTLAWMSNGICGAVNGVFSTTYWSDRGNDCLDVFTFTAGIGAGATVRVSAFHTGLGIYDDVIGLRGGNFFAQDHLLATGTSEWLCYNSDEFYMGRLESKNIRMKPLYMDWMWDLMTSGKTKNQPNAQFWIPFIAIPASTKYVNVNDEVLLTPTYLPEPGKDPSSVGVDRELPVGFKSKPTALYGTGALGSNSATTAESRRWSKRYFIPESLPEPCVNPYYFQIEAAAALLPGVRVGFNPAEFIDCLLGFAYVDFFRDDVKTYDRWQIAVQNEAMELELTSADEDEADVAPASEEKAAPAEPVAEEKAEEAPAESTEEAAPEAETKAEPALAPESTEEEVDEEDNW